MQGDFAAYIQPLRGILEERDVFSSMRAKLSKNWLSTRWPALNTIHSLVKACSLSGNCVGDAGFRMMVAKVDYASRYMNSIARCCAKAHQTALLLRALTLNMIGALLNAEYPHENKAVLDYFEESLHLYEDLLDPEQPLLHRDVSICKATALNNVGKFFTGMDDSIAIEYFNRAADIFRATLGLQHPYVAIAHSNLGACYNNLKNFEEALEHFQHAYNMQSRTYGLMHRDVAVACCNLGACYESMGLTTNSLQYFQQAYDTYKSVLAQNHPEVIAIWSKICELKIQKAVNSSSERNAHEQQATNS
jgi:tetratricopeptide (TPR) repeat protein